MRKHSMKALLTGAAMAVISGGLVTPAVAQDNTDEDPYLQSDETWISISGTVVEAMADEFELDYGEATVTVEMDDWDWYNENIEMIEGDKVTVYGEIDDDLYETTSIEASSVYVENMGTYFYASAADEEYEDDYDYWVISTPIVAGETVVRGTVTSVEGRELTIDTGVRELTVDTGEMAYNPLDDKGYQQVDVGDYVSVSGNIDEGLFEDREIEADSVITLDDA